MGDTYILHFNVKVKKSTKNYLNKADYCMATNEIGSDLKNKIRKIQFEYQYKVGKEREEFFKVFSDYLVFPNSRYKDSEHFSDEYIKTQYDSIEKNFDLNMKYFNSLDSNDFNKKVINFCKTYSFIETFDLNELKKTGIYIMVLDKYKQVYIGQAEDIKKRIRQHWNKKMPIERLIFGDVNTSILSINSFGALDTTRIFYKETSRWELNAYEEKYIKSFANKYLINRTAGGINGELNDDIRSIKLLGSRRTRELV